METLEREPELRRRERGETGKRIQFEFSPDAYERLLELKRTTDAGTYAEVVKNALRLYQWFIEQKAQDYEIGLIKEGKLVKQVEFYF